MVAIYVTSGGSLCFESVEGLGWKWRADRLRRSYADARPVYNVPTEKDANFLIALTGKPVGDRCVVRPDVDVTAQLDRTWRRIERARENQMVRLRHGVKENTQHEDREDRG